MLTEKKEPLDILEAYDSVKLGLNSNSSHMMPWHTRLGFMAGPCISTLYHLSPEGGVVAAMDFVVLKVSSSNYGILSDSNHPSSLILSHTWSLWRQRTGNKSGRDLETKQRKTKSMVHGGCVVSLISTLHPLNFPSSSDGARLLPAI